MRSIFEGRTSDSPYIEMIWRGHTEGLYTPVCPADVRWNLLFAVRNGKPQVSVEGPTTQSVAKYQTEDSEFLVIKFKLGVFMPYLPVTNLVNGDQFLPEGVRKSFWLNGISWEFPTYENVETFVNRLVRSEILVHDPVVSSVLQNELPPISFRTIRRRFLRATGLTSNAIYQIERTRHAANLLEEGVPILDVVHSAGFADQPHLTRTLRRFDGRTPAQIVRENQSA